MALFGNRLKLSVRVSLLYFCMNVVSIALFTYIITGSQASLISDVTRYQAKDVMALLVQNLRKLPAVQADSSSRSERLQAVDSTFRRLMPRYAIFTRAGVVRAYPQSFSLRPEHMRSAETATYLREFSGMDYFMQVDAQSDVLHFYVALDGVGLDDMYSVSELDMREIGNRFRSMYRLIGFTVLALTVLHVLFALLIFGMVIRPILRLYEATRKVTSGEYEVHVDVQGSDEISALSDGFNQMAATIRSTIGDLHEKVNVIHEAKNQMERMANMDELMQIGNRRYAMNHLERLSAMSQRYGNSLAVLLLDIDHFKQVNDRYGHQAGDEVLRVVATRLKSINRQSDILARYGGEELLLILPEASVQAALCVAEKLRLAICDVPVVVSSVEQLQISISIGVAEFTALSTLKAGQKVSSEYLLAQADAALYLAKKNGRNRVECATRTVTE